MGYEKYKHKFLEHKVGPTIDEWQKDGINYVNLAYWVKPEKRWHRINVIGQTLEEAITKAKLQEDYYK